ncbi:MAG TPA: ribosomal-processing cysteine protease Prp [Acetivibrio sp.]|nr:ribosomal-processing cysteine protease Prp [Acetivibrio sp.]
MTKVNVLVKNGTFVIDVEGHAENSKVCTAVTMIMQLALIGLQKPMVRLFFMPFFHSRGV